MGEFVKAAKVGDVPDPGRTMLEVADRLVVLIHAGGSFYCLDDVCTHDGGPLGEGALGEGDGAEGEIGAGSLVTRDKGSDDRVALDRSAGQLGPKWIACPRHGARFDIMTGRALTMPATEPTVVHEVRVEGEDVFIKINDQ